MATTTRALLRQRLSELINDWWSSTTSGIGTTTTLVDTTLAQLADNDDSFPNWFVLSTTGTVGNIGITRRAKLTGGYTASTGTITLSRAFPSATASADGYELHRIDPTMKHNALNRAAEILFPHLYLPVRDESIVVDDLLTNSDFETISAGDATGWTRVNSPTLTAETTIIRHSSSNGTQSAKVVAGGSVGRMYQAVSPMVINQDQGKQIKLKYWVYATVASTARIAISFDGGTTFTYSSYHSGNSDWELLDATTSIPATATSIRAYLEVAANRTAYFDAGWCVVDPVYRYTIPTTFIRGPHYVSMQYDESNPNGPYYPINARHYQMPFTMPFTGGQIQGRRLRLEGMGILSLPGSDSATMEIGGKQVDLLIARAAQWLFGALSSTPSSSLRDVYRQEEDRWRTEANLLLHDAGTKTPRMGAEMSRGVWHVEEDGTTRYIVLDRYKG